MAIPIIADLHVLPDTALVAPSALGKPRPSHGGVPAPGVLYGGASGPLFHGNQPQSPLPYTAAVGDGFRGASSYGGAPNHDGVLPYGGSAFGYRGQGGPPPFNTLNSQGSQPPFGFDP